MSESDETGSAEPRSEEVAKIALITGGSGGIGAATARDLARDGWSVAVGFRGGEAAAKAVVAEIEGEGGTAIPVRIDVTDEASVDEAFREVNDSLGPVTGLVNNAGMTKDGLTVKYSTELFEQTLRVNVIGTFLCTKAALRGMMRARWGRIVNISSAVALRGNPGQAAYTAAKSGVVGITRSNAREVAARGITVNVICPGLVDTEMIADLKDGQRQFMIDHTPVGRAAVPEDVSVVIRFLMSDEASYVNGVVLPVDGGLTA